MVVNQLLGISIVLTLFASYIYLLLSFKRAAIEYYEAKARLYK